MTQKLSAELQAAVDLGIISEHEALRKQNGTRPQLVPVPEPEPAKGAEALNDTRAFIRRFCAFPSEHCLIAVTLWAAHTHAIEHFYTTPRLAIISATLGSGKTRVLEILKLIVDSPMFAFNASPATIYRRLAERKISLLFDEVDTIWHQKSKEDNYQELRALMNAGYKKGAVVPRCVGPKHDVVDFHVFCPVAMAGIGELPETIMSRSIVIKMKRRAPTEIIESYRDRLHDPEGQLIRERLASWVSSVAESAGNDYPDLPETIVDRNAEVWEPLVAIADQAGGEWPQLAREAAIELCKVAEDRRVSLGVRLLADLKTVFDNDDKVSTATLIERLTSGIGLDDDAPWSDMKGKPVDSRKIAYLLRPFGIKSRNIQVGTSRPKGYTSEDLYDAWGRYLTPTPEKSATSATSAKPSNGADSDVADKGNVADTNATSKLSATLKPSIDAGLADVAAVADFPGQGRDVPDARTSDDVCPHCDGEGCGWCEEGLAS